MPADKHDADDLVPIHNHVPWYYITVALLVGSAMLAHGITVMTRGWEQELSLPRWFSIAGQVFGIVLSTALGCLAGYLVWEWALGGMVALVGACSSALVLSLVRAKIGAAKDTISDVRDAVAGKDDQPKR